MGILDGFLGNLGNLEEMAGKLGIPADKFQALTETLQGKLGEGGDQMSVLMQAAQEHGLSMDKLQEMLGGASGSAQDLLDKAIGMLDKDGDGNPFGELGGMVKGLFGKD